MSRNSVEDGTGGMSFHWVCVLVGGIVGDGLRLEWPLRGVEGKSDRAASQMKKEA